MLSAENPAETGGTAVSVVIPTYNRCSLLARTLVQLEAQTLAPDRFEVVVVDDGSEDETSFVAQIPRPYRCQYVWQENRGDACARNRGSLAARGSFLQFLDDDILPEPSFLAAVLHGQGKGYNRILMGQLRLLPSATPTPYEELVLREESRRQCASGEVHFTEILSGIMSLRRSDYMDLEMMQPVVSTGSSVWCDVEFAYRAVQKGFTFWKLCEALAYHDDYVLRDFPTTCQRAERAGITAVELFTKHPQLSGYLPAFRDKNPISYRRDNPKLVLRKLARQLLASAPLLSFERGVLQVVEQGLAPSALAPILYRWILSAHIYRGYRRGLMSKKAQ